MLQTQDADPYSLIIKVVNDQKEIASLFASLTLFLEIIVRDGREEAVLVQVFQGFGTHSFRDSVKFQTDHRGIN